MQQQPWRPGFEPVGLGEDPAPTTVDEASMERSKSFVKALQELKNLRPQLVQREVVPPQRAEADIVSKIKTECPHVPLVLYINGNGGLLKRMKDARVDVIGLDWTVYMADGRRRLGNGISVQGNVDSAYLFSPLPVLAGEIYRVVKSADPKGHILNLGHSVLVKTTEEAVAHFFDVMRSVSREI